ncbi:MAG TPA: hypothetical protein VK966_12525, partial [Longimicrobiales bacterium]|nr:hypothetical protein [Longimicrobiales bacterium]
MSFLPRAALPRTALAGAALLLAATLPGCANGSGGEPPGADTAAVEGASRGEAAAADTLRGEVAVVGADPLPRVVLRPASGDPAAEVWLTGPVADTLRSLTGVEVMVRLPRPVPATTGVAEALQPTAFRVRALEDAPAVDGVLEVDGDIAILATASGERLR